MKLVVSIVLAVLIILIILIMYITYKKYKTCIVTAYYNIKSKFPKEQYLEWIQNFMFTVKTDVVLYTTYDMKSYFQSYLSEKPNLIIIIKPLEQLYYYRFYDIFLKQFEKDPIKNRRSPELYIVWYNKLQFLKETSDIYGSTYDNYVWCDIGIFREIEFLEERKKFCVHLKPLENIMFLTLRDPLHRDVILYDDNIYGNMDDTDIFIGGSIIGVPYKKIKQCISLQNDVFNKLVKSKNRFFGCDQRCYAYMWAQDKSLIELIKYPMNYKRDPWFYLLDYF